MSLKDFENLIQPLLKDGKKFVSYKSNALLSPGENFGSTMLSINVLLHDQNGKEESVRCVAKLLPPKVMWIIINPKATFKYEMLVYKLLLPALNDFMGKFEGEKLTCFPKYFGARLSLNPTLEEIDEDAVIVLEDLKVQGFEMCNKLVGFNKATAKILLRDLAKLHAIPIAFKYLNPMEFHDNLLPLIKRAHSLLFRKETMVTLWSTVERELLKHPDNALFIPRVKRVFDEVDEVKNKRYNGEIREPFATLIHYDFWTNNVMVKFENGNPIASKILDFQMCDYNSCAYDILFFVYSSIQVDDLRGNLDYFLHFYHDQLMVFLSKMGCPTEKFAYDKFYSDVKYGSKFDLLHVLLKGSAIFAKKEDAKDLGKLNDDIKLFPSKTHENFTLRLHQIVKDFIERGWI